MGMPFPCSSNVPQTFMSRVVLQVFSRATGGYSRMKESAIRLAVPRLKVELVVSGALAAKLEIGSEVRRSS